MRIRVGQRWMTGNGRVFTIKHSTSPNHHVMVWDGEKTTHGPYHITAQKLIELGYRLDKRSILKQFFNEI